MKKRNYSDPPDAETIYRAVFFYDDEARCQILEHYKLIYMAKIRAGLLDAGLAYDWHLVNDIEVALQEKLLICMERFQ